MFTIGKLGTLSGVSVDTLRYYEREALIAPTRKSGGGYRLYDENSVRRVHFIKQAQQCGFALAEIREFLLLRGRDSACCNDVRKLAIEKKLQLEQKIKTLRAMSTALDGLIADCTDAHGAIADCPILAAFESITLSQVNHED